MLSFSLLLFIMKLHSRKENGIQHNVYQTSKIESWCDFAMILLCCNYSNKHCLKKNHPQKMLYFLKNGTTYLF